VSEGRTGLRIAAALMLAGTGLAVVSVGAWLGHFLPAVPAWMLQLAIYKLTFISGAGLVIAGAVVRRNLRLGAGQKAPPALGEGDRT